MACLYAALSQSRMLFSATPPCANARAQLYWTRAITGIAIGGGMPLVYSILGDLVSSTGRTEASGMVGISIGIGQGMGQVNFVSHFLCLGKRQTATMCPFACGSSPSMLW